MLDRYEANCSRSLAPTIRDQTEAAAWGGELDPVAELAALCQRVRERERDRAPGHLSDRCVFGLQNPGGGRPATVHRSGERGEEGRVLSGVRRHILSMPWGCVGKCHSGQLPSALAINSDRRNPVTTSVKRRAGVGTPAPPRCGTLTATRICCPAGGSPNQDLAIWGVDGRERWHGPAYQRYFLPSWLTMASSSRPSVLSGTQGSLATNIRLRVFIQQHHHPLLNSVEPPSAAETTVSMAVLSDSSKFLSILPTFERKLTSEWAELLRLRLHSR